MRQQVTSVPSCRPPLDCWPKRYTRSDRHRKSKRFRYRQQRYHLMMMCGIQESAPEPIGGPVRTPIASGSLENSSYFTVNGTMMSTAAVNCALFVPTPAAVTSKGLVPFKEAS